MTLWTNELNERIVWHHSCCFIKVAEERISNVRTVRSFAQEQREINQYNDRITHILKLGYKESLAKGVFWATVSNQFHVACCFIKVAEERISNVRTVRSFAQEQREINQYNDRITHILKLGYKESLAKGIFWATVSYHLILAVERLRKPNLIGICTCESIYVDDVIKICILHTWVTLSHQLVNWDLHIWDYK